MYFVDKDTGLPLSGGKVYFFQDGTNIPKPVYELSGNALLGIPYTYTVLPNPVTLSAVGTFQDASGNDILPYYFPYVSPTDFTIQLYYIEVYDSMGVLQFTRSAWPNLSAESITTSQDITNFIPNGQFLLHDNIPASSANGFVAGKVSQDITVIAQGGWTFERGPTSNSTDFVTFPAFATPSTSPTGNPPFGVQVQTTVAGTDARKDICISFPNVNTFASDTQFYNFYFEAESTAGGSIPVQIIVRKIFGTGTNSPSATTEDVVGSAVLAPNAFGQYNIPILFGTNIGKVIGNNNDSYVQIAVRLPPTGTATTIMTDFALTLNDIPLAAFPTQTAAQQTSGSTAGALPAPNPDGSSLYLPAVMGKTGFIYDASAIGRIEGLMVPNGSQTGNLIYCDGTVYLTADYSPLGIPYSRLQKVLFNSTLNGPLFGTGATFVNSYINSGTTAEIFIIQNTLGFGLANPADTGATGFTFNPSSNPGSAGTTFTAYANSNGYVTAFSDVFGAVADIPAGSGSGTNAGTSGMSISDLKQAGIANDYYSWQLLAIAASNFVTGGTGKYFDFTSTTTGYRFWFNTGTETVPAAAGRALVEVDLVSTMGAADVAAIIAARVSGYQTNTILVTGQPATVGSYFTFAANPAVPLTYYVWYKINGAGTAPPQPFAQLIEVDLTGGESAAQVAAKTVTAINSQYFATPDLRGYFLRGQDPTALVDTQSALRYGYFARTLASPVGTYEWDDIVNHYHGLGTGAGAGGGAPGTGTSTTNNTQAYGFSETRPVNASVNWFIRY
jgi:hypothetical protein